VTSYLIDPAVPAFYRLCLASGAKASGYSASLGVFGDLGRAEVAELVVQPGVASNSGLRRVMVPCPLAKVRD
jgi:hypothetical protein